MKTILAADLFCGAGGASLGFHRAAKALNIRTNLLAVNHWPMAIETHRLNFPEGPDCRHLCESIERVDPRIAVPGGRLQLLIAAPECTFFSTARGGRPVNDQQRTQPWVILKWLQELYVENVLIENVPEFVQWGPCGANGKPLKSKRGETFRAFIATIASLGYKVEHRILNAADYGDPTTRRRMFIMAKRGNKPIVWPEPTHSRAGGRSLFGSTKKWRAAREVIDWSIQGRSIFGRKKPLSPKTMARIMAGLERFGGQELKPFLILMRGTSDGHVANSARSLDEPLTTLTAGGGHHGLVEPFIVPVTHGGSLDRVNDLSDPMPTVTCAHRGELALVEPIIVPNNHNNRAKTLDEPLPTVTGGGRLMMVEPFILQQQSGGVPRTTDEPLPTIATDGAQMLVEPFLVGYHSERDGEQRRVHGVDEPIPTLTVENRFAVVEPFLVPHFGERPTQAPRTHSIDEPVPTIAATGQIDVVQPFIVSAGGPRVGPISTEEPMNTVLTRDHMAIVQPFILATGSNGAPRSVEEPSPTIVGAASQSLVEPFISSYYGTLNISPVSDPLPTVTTKDRFAIVMPVVNGRALDIRLRMLKPRELARAMSFGDDYQFAGNQGDQVKQVGNAWPCRLGQALIQTLLADKADRRRSKLEAIA